MSRHRMATRGSVTLGLAAALLLASVPVLFGTGENPASLDLLDRTAWLASELPGHVVRVSGDTGRPDARVELDGSTTGMEVDQSDAGVFVTVGDQVRRIDASTLTWASATERDGAEFVAGRTLGFLVDDDGHVRVLDAASMRVITELRVAGRAGDPVVTDGDELVVPIDGGRVQVVTRDGPSAPVRVGGAGIPQLASADGRVVALTGDEELVVLAADGSVERRFAAGVGPDEVLLAPEGDGQRAWMSRRGSGQLVGIDLRTGDAVRIDTGRRAGLGRPVVLGAMAYVVDEAASEVVAVDLAAGAVGHREPLDVDDAGRVQLTVRGDVVFVNDPSSELALVIEDGEFSTLDKYVDEGVAVSAPDEPEPADTPADPDPPASSDPSTAPPVVAPPAPGAGPPAPSVSSEPEALSAPGPVRAVTSVPGNRSATIGWSAPATGGAPARYELTWPGGGPVTVSGGAGSAQVDGLRNGDTYVITVRALNAAGGGPPVDAPPVTPTSDVPAVVEGVDATAGSEQATVTWQELPDLDIAAYVVQATVADGSTSVPGVTPVEVPAGSASATVTGLTAGHEWEFTVSARNVRGATGAPSAASAAVLVVGPPGPVGVVDVSAGDGAVGLAWGPSDERRSGSVSYEIVAQPAPGSGADPQVVTTTSVSVGGLQNGVTYTFTITPLNDHGRGSPTQVQARPARGPSVSGLQAGFSGDPRSDSRFDVSFTVDDGGLPTTCTVTVLRLDPAGPVQESKLQGCGTVSVDTQQLGRTYEVQVVATNEVGSSAPVTRQAAAPPKRIVLTSERLNPADGFDPGGNVALWDDPYPPDNINSYVANRSEADAVCWIDDGAVSRDLNGDYRVWVQLTNGLWVAASVIDSGPQVTAELGHC